MSVTIDGNSLVFDGVVTVANFNASPTTGVCTLILTPSGGVGSFPALAAGDPGPSPLVTLGTVTTLAAGEEATVTWDQTNAGGAGVASQYTVSFGLPQGASGTNGTTTIGDATDLSGTAVAGDIVQVESVSGSTPTFQYMKFPWGNAYNVTSFTAANTSGHTQATLASISIPGQPSAWYPVCFATAVVNGTANTVVELQAMLTSPTTGQVVGYVPGMSGTANQRLVMIPGYASAIGGSGYGAVAAGTAVELYLVALQTASVSDAWAIADTAVTFTVYTQPVSAT